jgi:glycosyltransferase involved in cell wall biosynthesis
MPPLVSVCMPVHNAERYLREAIESILAQTHTNFEFVIVDDCSTDSSWEIIVEYAAQDDRIVADRNETNLDVVKTRNKIFSLCPAKTEYYAIFDSDDVSDPTRLEKEVAFLEKNPGIGFVGANTEIIDENGKTLGVRRYPETHSAIERYAIEASPFAQPAIMIRRSVLEHVGHYNEEYRRCQDYELWMRMLQVTKGHNLQETLLRYRVSSTQGKSKHLRLTLRNTLRIQRKYLFTKKYFSLRALWSHLKYLVALLMPKKVVLWYYNKRVYNQ